MRRGRRPEQKPQQDTGPRINDRIRVPRVLVIGEEGEKLGEMPTIDALQMAKDRGVDLIEVAPMARPPVCRLGDFGRIKYEKKKKDADARKKQAVVTIKEVKLTPKTAEHDFQVKLQHARRFLEEGDKVKVSIRFRGREMAHREYGEAQCNKLFKEVEDLAVVESPARMDGRQMFMILAPKKQKSEAPPPRRAQPSHDTDTDSDTDDF